MGAPIKIVSDFDGVWTNQAGEARVIRHRLVRELAAVSGESAAHTGDRVASVLEEIHQAPHAHGWAPDGRITAFVDEDPLCEVNAFCVALEQGTRRVLDPLRRAIFRAGFSTVHAFAEHCFVAGMREFRQTHPPSIVPHAARVLEELHAVGAELVIVSNSEDEKLIDYFDAAGIDAGQGDGHTLRVRGSAAKWALGSRPDRLRVSNREFDVDRPQYRAALVEERPDLVIGDVFSLDLSLPHVMRARGEPGAARRLVLRRHSHTPAWAADHRADGAIDHVVEDLIELVAIVGDNRQ